MSANEGVQALLIAMNHLQALPELVEMAQVGSCSRDTEIVCILKIDAHVSKWLCLSGKDVPDHAI